MLRPWLTASDQLAISSPALAPTIVAPENLPALGRHHFDVTVRFALRLRAVVLVKRPAQYADAMPLLCLRLGQADMGKLGIGEGDPRHEIIIDLHRQPEQRVADHKTRVIIRQMRELRAAGNVADGIDALVAGAQPLVDDDTARAILDAGLVEAEAFDVGAPAGRDQNVASFERFVTAVRALDADNDFLLRGFDGGNVDGRAQGDSLAHQSIKHNRGAFRILVRERLHGFEHGDLRAQPAKSLREFKPDRSRADYNQVRRANVEIEHRLIGEVRDFVEPADRRNGRRRAAGNNKATRLDCQILDNHRVRIGETGFALDDAHAERAKALPGIVRRNRRDDATHVITHALEIDGDGLRRHAERRGAARALSVLAGCDQRLRRHASGIEAVASHLAFLDEHDRNAEGRGGRRDGKPAGACADDADIGFQNLRHARARFILCAFHACSWRMRHFFTATGMSAMTPSATKAAINSGVASIARSKPSRQSARPDARHRM